MKRAEQPSKYAAQLDAALEHHGITVSEVVATINTTRKDAMRYSTKDGEATGPDHATRAKMAVVLLDLMGLPSKTGAAAAPTSIKDLLTAAVAPEPEEDLFA